MTQPATARPLLPAALVRLAAPAVAGLAVQKGRIPLPAELVICPWGNSTDLSGAPVICNQTTVAELSANQSKYGFDEIALDFAHNTVPPVGAEGKPLKAPEPLPIAAMGKLSVVPGRGIIFTPSAWTPEGEQYYCGRHYKDLSPTVGKNDKGEVNFVHSVALTRAGQISGLHAYSAHGLPALTNLSTTTMDTTTAPDYRALLVKTLKLDDTATDEQIIAAIDTEAAEVEPLAAPEKPVTTPCAAAVAPAAIVPLAATAAPELTALQSRMDTMERDNLIAEAGRCGKIIPLSADVLALTPIVVLRNMIATLTPGTVPLSAGPTPAGPTPALKALSADESAVAARMGYTAEQWRAANPQ